MAKTGKDLAFTEILSWGSGWCIRINCVAKVTSPLDWRWDTRRGLPDFDLITILDGGGRYRGPNTEFEAGPGACLLLRPGERWRGDLADPRQSLTVLFAHFDLLDRSGAVVRHAPRDTPAHLRKLTSATLTVGLLERMLEAWQRKRPDQAATWLATALLELAREEYAPQWTGAAKERAEIVERLRMRIREAPGEIWSAERMARVACYSKDHLCKLFRAYAGTTPWAYLMGVRMEAAAALLRASSLSVARIAAQVGYADIYAFSRQFRRSMGVPPTAYRQGRPQASTARRRLA